MSNLNSKAWKGTKVVTITEDTSSGLQEVQAALGAGIAYAVTSIQLKPLAGISSAAILQVRDYNGSGDVLWQFPAVSEFVHEFAVPLKTASNRSICVQLEGTVGDDVVVNLQGYEVRI